MHYPTRRKVDDKKYVVRANIEDRNDIIKTVGKQEFYSNENYEYLWDIQIPPCFLFIFNVFLELYSHCSASGFSSQKNVTWQDIESYCHVRKLELTQLEVSYLLFIAETASKAIDELEKDDD